MLSEYKDLVDIRKFPKRLKYLQYYLVGFIDGEGCFSVSIKKQKDTRFGIVVDPVFSVVQHESRLVLLQLLKRTIKCGRIEKKHGQQDTYQFVVDNRRQLAEKLIPFLEKHHLIGKREELEKFKEIVERLNRKEHYTKQGLIKLVKLAYKMTKQQRKRDIEEVLKIIEEGKSSETIRQVSLRE